MNKQTNQRKPAKPRISLFQTPHKKDTTRTYSHYQRKTSKMFSMVVSLMVISLVMAFQTTIIGKRYSIGNLGGGGFYAVKKSRGKKKNQHGARIMQRAPQQMVQGGAWGGDQNGSRGTVNNHRYGGSHTNGGGCIHGGF